MRPLPFALLSVVLLSGCAGYIADHIGPRSTIVSPQLIRYGLDMTQTRCVAERLGASLSPQQLRRFATSAETVKQGYFDPGRLSIRDLTYVASRMEDDAVARELAAAAEACSVADEAIAAADPSPDAGPATATVQRPAWLNLGAAPTGQAIAVDASTIEQDASSRTAWFRMTNPGALPSDIAYRLRIDCPARTIASTAQRKQDAGGAVTEFRESGEPPIPVEGGTVMEIAYLALCT